MNIYLLILLRLVHIVAGVLWVGGAVIHTFFIEPTAKATAPESQKFIQYFMNRRHYSQFMGITSMLTVAAGAVLFWQASGGLQWSWLTSGPGIVYSLGAVHGIAVFILGMVMIKPRAERLGALGAAIGAAGGVPTPGQVAELRKLDGEMTRLGWADFVLLAVALATMATARYWYV